MAEMVLRTSVLVAQTQSALDAQLQDASELEQGIDNIDAGAVESEAILRKRVKIPAPSRLYSG